MKKAIVLLSGGLDSCVAMALALADGWECCPLTFDYKQRHKREVLSARAVNARYQAAGKLTQDLRVVRLSGLDIASALTSDAIDVPKKSAVPGDVSPNYVPSRNAIFFSVAMAFAESLGADAIFSGIRSASDCVGYPDARPAFADAIEVALNLGTERGTRGNPVKICTPLLHHTKAKIVELGLFVGAPLSLTWSCYEGQDQPCGGCGICRTRANAFRELGVDDPATT